jgi:NDP-sugar pyrophosphorylase family protein
MKAIILSACEGSRMRPLTLTKPKTMLPVAGKPIMQYNIESLRDNGIKDILLIVRYKEEMVRDYFGDGSEFEPTAKAIFGDSYDKFMEVNSDEDARAQIRTETVANFVKANNLEVTKYQDYGWDPVELPL